MVRYRVLAWLFLGLVVSCGSAEPVEAPSGSSAGRERAALALGARIQVSPMSLGFGNQKMGTSGPPQTVTVTNTGDATLQINSSSNGPFSVTPSGPLSLAPAATQSLTLTFTPTSVGASSGVLTLSSNDANHPSVVVALAGTGVASAADVSRTALLFGDQQVFTSSAPQSLVVRNVGNAALQITPAISGPFSISPTSVTIPVNGSANFSVIFAPTVAGVANATLSFTTNEAGNPSTPTVVLSGTGVQPVISVSPGQVAFGDVQVGASSTFSVIVSNAGSGTLNVSSATLSGSGAAAYTVTPTTLSIPPSQSMLLTVSFAPTAQATASATLTLSSNDLTRPTVTLPLTGRGVKPVISVSSSALFFGDTMVGSSSTQTVMVSNLGTGALNVSGIHVTGSAFSVVPASVVVQEGATVTLSVTFAPTVEGVAAGALSLSSNDVDHPTLTVTLGGKGVSPVAAVSPSPLAFGDVMVATSATQTVIVTNTGTGTLTVDSITLSGTGASSYSFAPGSLWIPPGASRIVIVTFAPTVVGPADATLTLNTNDPAHSAIAIALSGTGVAPAIAVSPASLAFGPVQVNTGVSLALAVTNTGTGTLHITQISKSGPGAAAYSFFPSTFDVPSGQTYSLVVEFSPTAEGPATATLTLATNDVARPTVEIPLSGTGGHAMASLSVSALDFGGVRRGTTLQRTVTLSNTGSAPLVLFAAPSVTTPFGYVGPSTFTLHPNSTLDFQVTFAPTSVTSYSGTLTFTSNALNSPTVLTLTGSGITPYLSVAPSEIAFGDVRVGTPSSPRAVTLNNSGAAPITLSALALTGADAAAFTLTGPSLPASLPAGATLTVTVTFLPDAERQFLAALRVDSSDPAASSVTVPLTGTGIPLQLHVSESTLEFGSQLLHTLSSPRKVRITHGGSSAAILSALVVQGAGASQFTVGKPALPLALAPGQAQEIEVGFTPEAEADVSGTLKIVFGDPILEFEVALHGRGIPSVLTLSSTALDFGQVEVDASSEPQELTLTNRSSQEQRVEVKLRDTEGSPFSVDTAALASPIPAGGSAAFKVSFRPRKAGETRNELQVWLQGATEPTAVISATGTGTEAQGGCSSSGNAAGGSGLLALLVLAALGSRRGR